jgi:large subunit ribosomal protein L30
VTEKKNDKAPKKARAAKAERAGVLRVRLAKSDICTPVDQKATVRALGFRRIGQIVEMPDGPAARGRIRKVRHLVEVLEGDRARAEN